MSRWIDAEYCEDFFDRWESRVKDADPVTIDVVQNTRTLLREAPSIDIVRCKECRWRGEQTESGIPYYWCRLVGVGYEVPIEHYCSYGERREP